MSKPVARIIFTPSGIRGEVEAGTDVLTAARKLGADLDTVCGGNGVCSRCKIQLSSGEFAKYGLTSGTHSLSALTAEERDMLGDKQLADGFRLGCRALVMDDVVIDIPPESQVHQQVVRKDATEIEIEPKPAVELVRVEVAEARLESPDGDLQRLKDALEFTTNYADLELDSAVYPHLQSTLRRGNWVVTVAIHAQNRIIAIWPDEQALAYGIAVDIGSTTIAAHLSELNSGEVVASAGLMNPQIRFGEDLMSRVSYVMMNPGGDREMTDAVRGAINRLLEQLLDSAQVSRDKVLDAVFVANPVMHHLFLGIDPVELGGAPFALATQQSISLPARDLGLKLAGGAQAYILPCIAGHVGADAAAVVLAEAPYRHQAMTLLIDVGTNAEIVLGNSQQLVAASSPTGPAFEGAQIQHGQRAAPGAIERVRIDRHTLEPRYKLVGITLWSDEPGFDTAVSDTGITGICGSGIIEVIGELFLAGLVQADGKILPNPSITSKRLETDGKTYCYRLLEGEPGIVITQNDVRAIQLAKATLYASIRLLMDKLGINTIQRIRFAGAFGTHIDPVYAMLLGMIPDCLLADVQSVGNAAGTGARIALLSRAARVEIEAEVVKLEKIETATEARFQEYFVDAMAIPHKRDAFPNLATLVTLPEPGMEENSSSGRRRRSAARKRRRDA